MSFNSSKKTTHDVVIWTDFKPQVDENRFQRRDPMIGNCPNPNSILLPHSRCLLKCSRTCSSQGRTGSNICWRQKRTGGKKGSSVSVEGGAMLRTHEQEESDGGGAKGTTLMKKFPFCVVFLDAHDWNGFRVSPALIDVSLGTQFPNSNFSLCVIWFRFALSNEPYITDSSIRHWLYGAFYGGKFVF